MRKVRWSWSENVRPTGGDEVLEYGQYLVFYSACAVSQLPHTIEVRVVRKSLRCAQPD